MDPVDVDIFFEPPRGPWRRSIFLEEYGLKGPGVDGNRRNQRQPVEITQSPGRPASNNPTAPAPRGPRSAGSKRAASDLSPKDLQTAAEKWVDLDVISARMIIKEWLETP
jgi:hypothetical protein